MKKPSSIFLFLLIIFLVSCRTSSTSTEVKVLPSPEAGKAVIHGQVLSDPADHLDNTTLRLAEVYRNEDGDGAFALDEATSPSTISDENGNFVFVNIEPGEYVLFIGSLHTDFVVNTNPDSSAVVYEVGPGETLEIEPIILNFE